MDLVLERAQMGRSAGTGGGLLAEAQELHQAGRYDEALTMYDEVLSADPTVYQINLNRAAVLRELGRPDDAKAAYQIVLDQEPGNAAALVSLGEMSMADSDMDGALAYWEQAVDSTEDEVIPVQRGADLVPERRNGQGDRVLHDRRRSARGLGGAVRPGRHRLSQQGRLRLAAAEQFEMAIEVEPESAAAAQAQAMLDALPKPE